MAILRSIPRQRRLPSLRNAIMVDAVRGVLRVRKWPRKRGPPRSALQRFWIDWFRQANLLAKYADGATQALAIKLTKGSGLYPRDIILQAMRGRLYTFTDTTGWQWYPVAAIEDVSKTLDILAQTIGSVLVRAADRWRAALPAIPVAGTVLTYQGVDLPPAWAAAGSGVSQNVLAGTPIVPDNTKSFYDISVEPYATVDFTLDQIGFAASDQPVFQLSTDGGSAYHTAGTDYPWSYLTSGAESSGVAAQMGIAPGAGSSGHQAAIRFTNLRNGRCMCLVDAARLTASVCRRSNFAAFDGPITHVRLKSFGGANFNAGTILATGILAA